MNSEKQDHQPYSRWNRILSAIVRSGSTLALLFVLLVVLDIILPGKLTNDLLIRKEAVHLSGSRGGSHSVYLRTMKFRFEVDMYLFNAFREGETVPIQHTLIFKMPTKVEFQYDGQNRVWHVSALWYLLRIGLACFIGFSAYINLSRKYDPETNFKAGVAAIVFSMILCFIIS